MPKFILDEVQEPTPLEIFYSREPNELTDEQLDALVAAHRAEREDRQQKAAKRTAKAAAKKVATKKGG